MRVADGQMLFRKYEIHWRKEVEVVCVIKVRKIIHSFMTSRNISNELKYFVCNERISLSPIK